MTQFTDLSLDLETLGVEPGCVITQIGMAAFNARDGMSAMDGALIHVNPQSCIDAGMHVAWSTISWWLQQADAPRLSMARAKGLALYDALANVTTFCALNLTEDFKIWGNGATFDVSLLADAYKRIPRRVPWGFRNVRDMRTLCAMCPPELRVSPDVEHDAESDARAQALTIQNCMAWSL
jgi:exodeoxyribonuclease VIII